MAAARAGDAWRRGRSSAAHGGGNVEEWRRTEAAATRGGRGGAVAAHGEREWPEVRCDEGDDKEVKIYFVPMRALWVGIET